MIKISNVFSLKSKKLLLDEPAKIPGSFGKKKLKANDYRFSRWPWCFNQFLCSR